MKKYLKVIIGAACCLVLIGGGVLALKKDNVVVWATPFYISERTEQLINSALKQNGYNTSVKFKLFDAESYDTEIRKEISAGNIDIVFCGLTNWNQVGNRYALNDVLLNLEGYLETENGIKLYNSYPKRMWDSITINEEIYWICGGGNLPTQRAVLVDEKLQGEYSLEDTDICYENMCNLVLEAMEDDDEVMLQNHALLLTAIPNVSYVCSPFIPLVINENESNMSVENLWENSQFENMYNQIREINLSDGIDWARTESSPLFQVIYYTTGEDCTSMGLNTDNMIMLEEAYYNPLETIGTYVGIAESSKNKEEAFEVLVEIYTSAEYSDIFAYGEKGVDYEIINGHAVTKGTHEYLNPYTVAGNMFLTTPTLYQGENKKESYYKELECVQSSKLIGFVFDGRNVKEEMKRVTDVVANFYIEISNNPEALNYEMDYWQSLLKEAGIEKIKLEVESQLNNWRETQYVETD